MAALKKVKPLNIGHLQVLKNLSIIERCPLLRGDLKKIVTFGTQHLIDYSWDVRCLECSLLGGFTVVQIPKWALRREYGIFLI